MIVHRRYNPEGISQYNIVPGLLGVILQMTMVMMTSIALTRETERGTMETLLAMPSTPAEVMLEDPPLLCVGASRSPSCCSPPAAVFDVPFVGALGAAPRGRLRLRAGDSLLGYAISTSPAPRCRRCS